MLEQQRPTLRENKISKTVGKLRSKDGRILRRTDCCNVTLRGMEPPYGCDVISPQVPLRRRLRRLVEKWRRKSEGGCLSSPASVLPPCFLAHIDMLTCSLTSTLVALARSQGLPSGFSACEGGSESLPPKQHSQKWCQRVMFF